MLCSFVVAVSKMNRQKGSVVFGSVLNCESVLSEYVLNCELLWLSWYEWLFALISCIIQNVLNILYNVVRIRESLSESLRESELVYFVLITYSVDSLLRTSDQGNTHTEAHHSLVHCINSTGDSTSSSIIEQEH